MIEKFYATLELETWEMEWSIQQSNPKEKLPKKHAEIGEISQAQFAQKREWCTQNWLQMAFMSKTT